MISVRIMTYKLKKNNSVTVLFCLLVIFIFVPKVMAHSPNSMTLEYDENTNQLDVTITHPVSDNLTHYIEEVRIKVNSTLNQPNEYNSQPGNTFTYSYTIEAAPGTRFEVKATCSISGDITRSIVVPGGPNTPDPTIPLNTGLILLSVLIGTVLLVFKQYNSSKCKR